MPTIPISLVRQSPRMASQKWLVDEIIQLVGVEWDQGREVYYAAACGEDCQGDFIGLRKRIKKYDDIARESAAAARHRELRARTAEQQHHPAAARESYFTAAVLYGAAQWPIQANTEFNLLLERKKTACYAAFMALAGRHIERVEIPFEGQQVPAYLHLPPGYDPQRDGRLPCVLMLSGMDGFKEISVAMDGDRLLNRGLAVLAVDGPGQGECLTRGVWYDPTTYGRLGPAAYELLAAHPNIDPQRVLVVGLSFGSFWATQLATAEPRFAACAAVMTCFEPHGFSIFETASPTFKLRFLYMTGSPDEAALDELLQRVTTAGLAAKMKCPYLIIAGEDDNLSDLGNTYDFLNQVTAPKTLMLYQGEDHGLHSGTAGQVGPEAFSAYADWLYDRAQGVAAESTFLLVNTMGQVTPQPYDHPLQYTYGYPGDLHDFD